jgi:glycosyltransferase involved in cell wall biosynthesis
MDVIFLGGYDRAYPRNAVLRRGLSLAGASVSECHVRPGYKFWLRYPRLTAAWLTKGSRPPGPLAWDNCRSYIFVPEFCQKDVPLARLLAAFGSRRVIFDPLASRFETKIVDWGWRSTGSLAAWWNRTIDALAFRLSGLILADTAAHRDYYAGSFGLPEEKFAVVPVGFDDRVFTRDLARAGQAARAAKPEGAPFTVLFFGSFLPLHGVDFIIDAARGVWERDRSVRFLMIGGGRTLPSVKACAAGLGLGNIDFEGWQGQAALAGTAAVRADICLGIFGRTEKAARVVPHKIFQSMAMAKAVVTARTPAVEEFFGHGRDIYLCDNTRPGSLAEAVLALKNDAGLRESIAQKGYELAWEKFQPAALGTALRNILEGRMKAGPKRGTVPEIPR